MASDDGVRTLQGWRAQIGEGWILVDTFERDGRRYVLAVQSCEFSMPGFELLSVRERQVLRQASLGRHNKAIAYEMGLAHSTVRVLLARAAAKVGAHSRRDLLEKVLKAQPPARITKDP